MLHGHLDGGCGGLSDVADLGPGGEEAGEEGQGVTYRYSATFSVTFGLAAFAGREEGRPMAISPTSLSNRTGRYAYKDLVENGLSAVRDRDEIFLRVRYTF